MKDWYLPNLTAGFLEAFDEDGTLSISTFVWESKAREVLSKLVVSASPGESPMSLAGSEDTGTCMLVLLTFSALFPSFRSSASLEEPYSMTIFNILQSIHQFIEQ